jgi:bifunctional UDP-N-acetylglucosamine pyrophosphorylase/glucosamine-1-phosphate N-acetyltransferase
MTVCAVVPAAGRGTRLGAAAPKVLLPIADGITVWTILRERLFAVAHHIHVVLAPSTVALFEGQLAPEDCERVSFSVQPQPTGMGDAVFRSRAAWERAGADVIVIVWGDQLSVTATTLAASIAAHAGKERRIVIPLADTADPYAQYMFEDGPRLREVRQAREGERCDARGLSDVGVFTASAAGFAEAWRRYTVDAVPGTLTREVNFIPFLPWLSANGWEVVPLPVAAPEEARGINTPEDLQYFRQLYSGANRNPTSAER